MDDLRYPPPRHLRRMCRDWKAARLLTEMTSEEYPNVANALRRRMNRLRADCAAAFDRFRKMTRGYP